VTRLFPSLTSAIWRQSLLSCGSMASDLGLQMFHDGPVSHSHQSCGNCFQVQRSHGQKLSLCGGCKEVKYCVSCCHYIPAASHSGCGFCIDSPKDASFLIIRRTKRPARLQRKRAWRSRKRRSFLPLLRIFTIGWNITICHSRTAP
jgi:hypothetical protein